MAWSRRRRIPIISTCEIYSEHNSDHKNYCLDGTDGQKKIAYTLVNNHISYAADGNTNLPCDILQRYHQVILHKRTEDPFEEPRIERLLTELKANEFILIGASIEGALQAMALGLLQRGKKVTIVVDASGIHNRQQADMALRKVKAKGAKLVETKKIAGSSHLKLIGICDCKLCQKNTLKEDTHPDPLPQLAPAGHQHS